MRGLLGPLSLLLLVLHAPASHAQATCPIGQHACCTSNAHCDDGNPCNGDETCGDEAACVAGTPATGADCDDGNACTQIDTCQDGACVGGNPRTCDPIDDCHTAACNPATGACEQSQRPDDFPCNDGNACTQTDTCQGGTCTGGNPTACTPDDACHTAACNPGSGACDQTPRPDDFPCNDGNACTQTDTCQAGACTGANPIVCSAADTCHDAGTCDAATGLCSNPQKPAGAPCDDGNACTLDDACDAGGCVPGEPRRCAAIDQCHGAGVCDPDSGACSTPALANGTPCDDADLCTRSDRCQSGACVGGDPVVCADDVACTADRCVAGTCVFEPVTARCADATCTRGECRPDAPESDSRGCVAVPVLEGEACTDDGFACTDDLCTDGTCQHPRVDDRCSAGDACSTAICFPGFPTADARGCTAGMPSPDGGECREDADPCTEDRCTLGTCTHADVAERNTCDPVAGAYGRALALIDSSTALGEVIAASLSDGGGQPRSTRQLLDERLEAIAGELDVIVRILGGRAPTPDTSGGVAQRRARAAMPVATGLIPRVRGMVGLLRLARRAGELAEPVWRQLGRETKALLVGAKALKRDLKRIQRISRVFAR